MEKHIHPNSSRFSVDILKNYLKVLEKSAGQEVTIRFQVVKYLFYKQSKQWANNSGFLYISIVASVISSEKNRSSG